MHSFEEPEMIDAVNQQADIGDTRLAVGSDLEVDDFGEVIELCFRSPFGQCQYTWRDNWHACMFCHNPSGLDQ